MKQRAGRDLVVLGAAALLSTLAPVLLARHVDDRLQRHAVPALSRALGEPVAIGSAEVELEGTLRLTRVRVGDSLAADAISASVAPTTLMAGRFGADEVRVERPRLRARVAEDGSIDLTQLLQRARDARRAARGPAGEDAAGDTRIRRILVTGGELVLVIDGRGEIRARDVELHPQEGGVRVIASSVDVDLGARGWTLEARFARTGVDVSLPRLHVGRAALAGGTLALVHGDDPPLLVDEVVVARDDDDARTTRVDGRLAERGTKLELSLARAAGGGHDFTVSARELPGAPIAAAMPVGVDSRAARLGGRVTGHLDARRVRVEGQLVAEGLALTHGLIAADPVPTGGTVELQAEWDRALREGHLGFQAQTGALALHGEAELALDASGGARAGRLYLELPELQCADALAAVPAPLRRPLDGLQLDGRLAGRVELAFDTGTPDVPAVFEIDLDNRCVVADEAPGSDPRKLAGAYVHVLPGGQPRTLAATDPAYVALASLPRHVVDSFVGGEDARFFQHHGFDEEQLRRSFEIDVAAGRVERGGSTISQQVAKNLFLSRDRTLLRKLLEAVLTWRLEQRVDKRRILEVYLNIIELGDGVYGLGPGAAHWFGKPARKLSLAESAFLAAITPGPRSAERRIREHGGLDAFTRGRVEAVLRSMRRSRLIGDAELGQALHDVGRLRLRLDPAG